jgi:hypothetical protein
MLLFCEKPGAEPFLIFGMRNGAAFPKDSIAQLECAREEKNGLALSRQPGESLNGA